MPAATSDRLPALTGLRFAADVPYPLLYNGALVPLLALLVVGTARAAGPLARILGSSPAQALGDASFALYALQEPLWLWARRLAAEPGRPASALFVAGFAAAAIAISLAVSSRLERPARRALRALLAGERGPTRDRAREERPSSARAYPPPRP